MKKLFFIIISGFILSSCAGKKDIYYLQDGLNANNTAVNYTNPTIQPNDILKITVESEIVEAAIPYNKVSNQGVIPQNIELLQIDGYLVSLGNTINFPVLGELSTRNKTTKDLELFLKNELVNGGHLKNPTVSVRLINAKVTVLGEVNQPGTYNFTEQNITLLQALGYAGDLTINGKRDDILLTREVDGVRKITHIDLTTSDFMNSDYYFIKPNDVIVVNPNKPRVTSSGYISDVGVILTIASLALSVAVLLSR